MSLPIIRNDQDWLDLRTGDKAVIRGLLEHVSHDGLLIGFADWTSVSVDGLGTQVLKPLLNQTIELTVTRTEDGLSTSVHDVRNARAIDTQVAS